MNNKSSEFVNIQKMIQWQLENNMAPSENLTAGNPVVMMSSYDLVEFLRSQIQRSNRALAKIEMRTDEVSRLTKARV